MFTRYRDNNDHDSPGHDRDNCHKCNTDRVIQQIRQSEETTMATLADIQAKLDALTLQESGEQVLAPGQVAVDQAGIDAIDTGLAGLIDKHTNPPVVPPAV